MIVQTEQPRVELGEVIFIDKNSINDALNNLEYGVSFANEFVEEFNSLKLEGTVLEFIQACMSGDQSYKYVEEAAQIALNACKESGQTLPALIEVVKREQVQMTADFVKKVKTAIARDSKITSIIHELEMIDGEVSVKKKAVGRIKDQFTIALTNDEQVDFWNTVLSAKEHLEKIKETIIDYRPENTEYDINTVLQIVRDLGSGKGEIVHINPHFVKYIGV